MISQMTSRREVTVSLPNGLHLVPCSRIATFVRDYNGQVQIHREETTVDAKSILDLMTLRAPAGTVLVLEASGEGADTLLDGLEQLFATNFEA